MNWYIPNTEDYVLYAIKEIARWSGDNAVTVLVVTNVLTYLKTWAIKSDKAVDDKIITLLLYFLRFDWLRKLLIRNGL